MKANIYLNQLLVLILALAIVSFAQAQFETTFGNLSGSEEMTDMKNLPNGHTIVLGTTTSFGAKQILLAELNSSGYVIWFRAISEPGESNVEYAGNGIELDYNADGVHSGYFITGCRHGDVPQMLIIRTDMLGTPLWTMSSINVDGQGVMDEYGVSLERMDNGDIIAVGNSFHRITEEQRFIVTRITPDGTIIWSHRYGSSHEMQFVANESCRGVRNGTNVIAVVGQVEEDGDSHTFLSCIKVGTGQEIWRRRYISPGLSDNGYDVVQNPVTQHFVVVGASESPDGYSSAWAFNANAFSGYPAATTHFHVLDNNLVATAVCLNTGGSSAIIVGRRDTLPDERMAFAMRVPLMLTAPPVWSYYYEDSYPSISGFVAVDRAGTFGYLLATTGKLTGAGVGHYDLHLTRVNGNGQHELDCDEIPFNPEQSDDFLAQALNKKKSSFDWTELTLVSSDEEYIQEHCESSTDEAESGAPANNEFISALSIDVFPNPIHAGDLLSIQATLSQSVEVEIQLLDMTHRPVAYAREYRDAGTQTLALRIPGIPHSGVYYLKVTLATGQQSIVPLVIEG